mmetsp:Transcript_909/g.5749  ORF Transcript_909/g.5749 Transcript_909/m.5749 type:complete len:82 (+) Transcript_909:1197-1442(+)
MHFHGRCKKAWLVYWMHIARNVKRFSHHSSQVSNRSGYLPISLFVGLTFTATIVSAMSDDLGYLRMKQQGVVLPLYTTAFS